MSRPPLIRSGSGKGGVNRAALPKLAPRRRYETFSRLDAGGQGHWSRTKERGVALLVNIQHLVPAPDVTKGGFSPFPGDPCRAGPHRNGSSHGPSVRRFDARLHHRLLPPEGDRDAAGTFETLPCVLPVPEGDKEWYLYAARAGLLIGVASHRRFVGLNTIARREDPTNRPAPPPFSPIVARHRRWLAA